jgi:hypothetical protein
MHLLHESHWHIGVDFKTLLTIGAVKLHLGIVLISTPMEQ